MAAGEKGGCVGFRAGDVSCFLEWYEGKIRRLRVDFEEGAKAERRKLPCFVREAINKLKSYFNGEIVEFESIPLDYSHLSPFALKVFEVVRRIPYGCVVSYGYVARSVGSAGASRAVGRVLSRNPFPIFIPCHRVIRSNGAAGGFSGASGVDFKIRLIEMEKSRKAK